MIRIQVHTTMGQRPISVNRYIDEKLLEVSNEPEAIAIAEFLIAWRTSQLEIKSYTQEVSLGSKSHV